MRSHSFLDVKMYYLHIYLYQGTSTQDTTGLRALFALFFLASEHNHVFSFFLEFTLISHHNNE